LTIVPFE